VPKPDLQQIAAIREKKHEVGIPVATPQAGITPE
jgi:hypothetical protein